MSSVKRHQNYVCSTLKSGNVIILSLVRLLFSPKIPKWGVLVNRLIKQSLLFEQPDQFKTATLAQLML